MFDENGKVVNARVICDRTLLFVSCCLLVIHNILVAVFLLLFQLEKESMLLV